MGCLVETLTEGFMIMGNTGIHYAAGIMQGLFLTYSLLLPVKLKLPCRVFSVVLGPRGSLISRLLKS